MWQESNYCENALSPKGAIGLGQIMPATALDLGIDPYDTYQNLSGAAYYLKTQLDTFGDVRLALAAYNAGPQRVLQFNGVPPFAETQAYIPSVLKHYEGFKMQNGTYTASVSAPEKPLSLATEPSEYEHPRITSLLVNRGTPRSSLSVQQRPRIND